MWRKAIRNQNHDDELELTSVSAIYFNVSIAMEEKVTPLSIDLLILRAQDLENPGKNIQQEGNMLHTCMLSCAKKVSQHYHVFGAPSQPSKYETLSMLSHFCRPDHMQIFCGHL